MRLIRNTLFVFSAIVALAITANQANAQSGTRGGALPAYTAPVVNTPTLPGVSTIQPTIDSSVLGSSTVGSPALGSSTVGSPTFSDAGSFGAPIPGGGGCNCSGSVAPAPAVSAFSPSPTLFGGNDLIGTPSLCTPPRCYRPPFGRQVGRPIIGRWQGY